MRTGTGAGMETRAVVKKGMATRMRTGAGTRTRSARAEKRRETARNRIRVIDAIRHFHSHASYLFGQGLALAGTR